MRRSISFMERWGLVALVLVGGIYGYLEFLREPLLEDYDKLVKQNNALVKAINEFSDELQSPDAIKTSAERLQKELTELEASLEEAKSQALTPPEMLEETVMRVSEVAANNGLRVGSLAPLKEGGFDLFPSIQNEQKLMQRALYRMKLSGDFLSFYDFLAELTKLDYMVNVAHLIVQGDKDSRGIDVDLVLVI